MNFYQVEYSKITLLNSVNFHYFITGTKGERFQFSTKTPIAAKRVLAVVLFIFFAFSSER